MATRTRTAPAKKATSSRTTRPAAKAAPAAKRAAAAPARKAAPPAAKRTAPARKAAAKPVQEVRETPSSRSKIQAHDVLRAELDARKARHVADELHAAYWAEYGEVLDFAVDTAKAVSELDAPKQSGPHRKDGPARRAMVEPSKSVIGEVYDRERLESHTSLPELRKIFKELCEGDERLEETLVKKSILAQMEKNGYFREEVADDSAEDDESSDEAFDAEDDEEEDDFEDDDEESDDDDDDDAADEDEDESDEDGVLTEEDLDDYTLKQLREVAEESNVPIKGKSEDALRDELKALVRAASEEEEDEDDQDEEDDDEEDEGEDGGYVTAEDLPKMDLEALQKLSEECDGTPKKSTFNNAEKLRAWLLPYVEADDDEEEEEDDDEE